MPSPNKVSPTFMRDFLKSHGWEVNPRGLDDDLYVLENSNYARRQLIFPTDQSSPDYFDSIGNVVEKLSDLMGVSIRSIISGAMTVNDDVLRLRVKSDQITSSLSLDFASALVNSAQKALKSAACTVIRPRASHPRLTLSEATQLVEKARFGQTEEGSFILNVSCPINSMDVQGALELSDADAPFVRKVYLTLHDAVEQLVRSIKADNIEQLVAAARTDGAAIVSSNLCEALGGMQDERVSNSVDLDFTWSALRPLTSAKPAKRLTIQSDYFPRIEEVRRELRSIEINKIETYIGTVERLDGEMDRVDGRRSGTVVLSLLLPDEGETVRARVILNKDEYEKADRAHMTNGAYVQLTGKLLPGRQPRQLSEPTDFGVLSLTSTM